MDKRRILVIDDEKDFTEFIKLNLELTGKYEVRTENKGANGLAAAMVFKPDLIFLDIRIPDMEGSVVAKHISEDETIKYIPLVFLTAVLNRGGVGFLDCVMSGHFALAKPVETKELVACIEKFLGK